MEANTRNRNVKQDVMQGNEACAKAAIDAGCRFFAGYPITPSTEIIESMSLEMPKAGGTFIQMEDEIASACAIVGARWGGKKAMTATSGPGFTLMQEAIGYAAVTETPVVIVDVQRGGPATGQPTRSSQQDIYQAKYGSHGDYEIIALAPSSVQEMYDFTVKAFALSEEFRTPVILLADEIVGHMREKIIVSPEEGQRLWGGKKRCASSPQRDFFQGENSLVEGQLHREDGMRIGHLPKESGQFILRINKKIKGNVDLIADVDSYYMEDAEAVILAYGSVARPAMDAVRLARGFRDNRLAAWGRFVRALIRKGVPAAIGGHYSRLKVGLIKVNTVWPFPEEEIKRLAQDAKVVLVPEMNIGKYCLEVERALKDKKVISLGKCGGEIHTPQEILDKILKEVGIHEPAL